jgi:hypothetical protein
VREVKNRKAYVSEITFRRFCSLELHRPLHCVDENAIRVNKSFTFLSRSVDNYRAIKLICNRVINEFDSVCLLRLICRDLTCVSRCDYWSVEFKKRHTISDSCITPLQINLIALYN